MPTLVIGNSASYDGDTNNAAGIASTLGSDFASASSGALTLKHGVDFDNSTSSLKVRRTGQPELGAKGGETVTANKQGPVTITAADAGLFGVEVVINSGVYLYSDDTSQPALDIQVNGAVVTNNGIIMGKGGKGGDSTARYSFPTGSVGGPAVEIASGVTGVTIVNGSGAYIAGGGGGGATGRSQGDYKGGVSGGGGGAGGGAGGRGFNADTWGGSYHTVGGGAAGGVNAAGGNSSTTWGSCGRGIGGGAGGGGGAGRSTSSGNFAAGGGGGGRIIPGTGGATSSECSSWNYRGGAGGAAGNAGANGTSSQGAGGGGGYGAKGGNGRGGTGAAGGAAIKDNGQTYTLTNSGTIYGTT